MFRQIILLIGFMVASVQSANAVDVSIRPDLGPRLIDLRPIYSASEQPVVDRDTWRGTDWKDGIVLVSGVIEAGDLAKLEAVIGAWDDDEPKLSPPFHVVFDSPGGNFIEAVKLGEYLSGWRGGNGGPALGGVFVLEGHECLSACAIAFALSALSEDKGLERFVEAGGSLGFHMPFLPPEQAEQSATIGQAMEFTYDVVAEYLKLIENGKAPTALAQNALYYRTADDFFMLSGGIMTRVMGFDPVAKGALSHPVSFDGLLGQDVLNACRIMAFTVEGGLDPVSYEWWGLDGAGETACIWGTVDSYNDTMLQVDRSSPITAGMLGEVLGCHGGSLTSQYYYWDMGNRFLDEEEPEEYAEYTRRYAEYHNIPFEFPYRIDWNRTLLSTVNMRDAPGMQGQRLGRLQEGTPVQVTDCRIVEDAQGVWFEVSTGGQSGWVSGRYVSRMAGNYLDFANVVLRPAAD